MRLRHKYEYLYYVVYMVRRLVFSYIVVSRMDRSSYLTVNLVIYLNLAYLCYICTSHPQASKNAQ